MELPPVVAAASVAAIIAPIGSVMSLAAARYYERKKAIEQDIRAKKTAVYEGLLELWSLTFMGEKMGKRITDGKGDLTHEFVQRTHEVHRGLVILSNQEVLRRWSRLRRASFQAETKDNPAKYVADLEQLLRAIRVDIGHSNSKLAPGDIVGLYINDIPVPVDEPTKRSVAKKATDHLAGAP